MIASQGKKDESQTSFSMESRMRGNSHVRFGSGEKAEITSKPYLSTSAAYAVIGYQTGYLMYYYPSEFIAAMLNSFIGNAEKCNSYLRFAKGRGIKVVAPDINLSDFTYKVKDGAIIFGLGAMKGVGRQMVDSMVEERLTRGPYKSLMDFSERNSKTMNKRALEALIKAGAFDGLLGNRAQMLGVYDKILDGFTQQNKKLISGQVSLFGDIMEEDDTLKVEFPKLKEFDQKDLLFMEKEMTGMYMTGHPLDEYEERLRKATSHSVFDILEEEGAILDDTRDDAAMYAEALMSKKTLKDNDRVILGGMLQNVTRKITKNGAMMAFIQIEDLTGTLEAIVFPKTYDKVVEFLKEDAIILARGRLSIKEEENPKLIIEEIENLETMNKNKLYLRFKDMGEAQAMVKVLKPVLRTFSGSTPVIVVAADKREVMQLTRELWVDEKTPIVKMLREKLGEENVKLVEA